MSSEDLRSALDLQKFEREIVRGRGDVIKRKRDIKLEKREKARAGHKKRLSREEKQLKNLISSLKKVKAKRSKSIKTESLKDILKRDIRDIEKQVKNTRKFISNIDRIIEQQKRRNERAEVRLEDEEFTVGTKRVKLKPALAPRRKSRKTKS